MSPNSIDELGLGANSDLAIVDVEQRIERDRKGPKMTIAGDPDELGPS